MVTKLSDIQLAFVDIETTGLNLNEHEIIEIAAVIYDQKKDIIVREWEIKIAPKRLETAEQKALQLNGYIKNQNLYKNKLKPSLIKFNSIIKNCILVGQNINFDVSFIKRDMNYLDIKPKYDYRKLDIMSMAWLYVNETDIPGLSLKKLCEHFNVSNADEHTALADCRRAFQIYNILKGLK